MTSDFLFQSAALAWATAAFFAAGARSKRIPFNRATVLEIAQAVLIVVAVFAVASDLRGCARSTAADLHAAACPNC